MPGVERETAGELPCRVGVLYTTAERMSRVLVGGGERYGFSMGREQWGKGRMGQGGGKRDFINCGNRRPRETAYPTGQPMEEGDYREGE